MSTYKDDYGADMRLSFYRLHRALGLSSEPRDVFSAMLHAMSKRLTAIELDDARMAFDAMLRDSPVLGAKGDQS